MDKDQSINGDGNQQAGRDIINMHGTTDINSFIFYEKDLEAVVMHFHSQKENILDETNDLERIDISEKNKKNNLSPEYFEFIEETSLSSFKKIETFLQHSQNQEVLAMYRDTTTEIQHNILANGTATEPFEKVLKTIYGNVLKDAPVDIQKNRMLVLKFIHYMYWNCDIGLK